MGLADRSSTHSIFCINTHETQAGPPRELCKGLPGASSFLFLSSTQYRSFISCPVIPSHSNRQADHPEPDGPTKTVTYALSFLNLVDLAAILPFYLHFLTGGMRANLVFLRLLRLLRVVRVFKLGRYSDGHAILHETFVASVPALLIMCFFMLVVTVLFGALIYCETARRAPSRSRSSTPTAPTFAPPTPGGGGLALQEHPGGLLLGRHDGHNREYLESLCPSSLWDQIILRWYWMRMQLVRICATHTFIDPSIMHPSQVGYGDFYPSTTMGRFIAIIVAYSGIVSIALPVRVPNGLCMCAADQLQINQPSIHLTAAGSLNRQQPPPATDSCPQSIHLPNQPTNQPIDTIGPTR